MNIKMSTNVIEGDLETRMLTFAVNAVDRKNLLTHVINHLNQNVSNYSGDKTDNLFNEVAAFCHANVSNDLVTAYAVRNLIAIFNDTAKSGSTDFSTDVVKLGSAISILYIQTEYADDEIARELLSFLFDASGESGSCPQGMPTAVMSLYMRVLCNYTVRALNAYCAVHNY